jgi:hypothetical protein
MVVEVRHVLGQHCREMVTVDDEDPVEQFAAGSGDPSFGDRGTASSTTPVPDDRYCRVRVTHPFHPVGLEYSM